MIYRKGIWAKKFVSRLTAGATEYVNFLICLIQSQLSFVLSVYEKVNES